MCFSQYFTIPNASTGPDRIPKIAIKVQIESELRNVQFTLERYITALNLARG